MKLTYQPPAWLRRVPRPPSGPNLLAVPLLASPLAADSISQVLNNTTLWIIGILAGLATLMLTLAGSATCSPTATPPRSSRPRPRCAPPRSATGWRSSPR